MTSYIHSTLTKISSDKDELYDASSILSVRIKQNSEADLLKQRAITNITTILNLVEIQTSLEQDSEILTVLEDQKTNLKEILKKKTDKKSSFKTAENEAISKLQNQFSSLKKSVDQKFNTILQSIKNNHSTVNS